MQEFFFLSLFAEYFFSEIIWHPFQNKSKKKICRGALNKALSDFW